MKNFLGKRYALLTASLCLWGVTTIQAQHKVEIPLWPDGAPTSNGITEKENMGEHGHLFHVSEASVTIYLPKENKGKAVIACPGGGYSLISSHHEGHHFHQWFNDQGITYVVLKYRLPNGHHEIPLHDAHQAIRLLHQHAQEWNIKKIGIMGFSAGGHLASTAATHYTEDTRPDFQILFYPVISMQQELTHRGTRHQLLGPSPSKELIHLYSNEMQVDAQTPPAFLLHCSDDPAVPVANSLRYYEALLKNKVSATLHCYPNGGHGWGCKESFPHRAQWMSELTHWLEQF